MSEIVDAQIAEWCQYGNNPEGYPECSRCGEWCWMDESALETGNYICGNCGNVFPILEE